MSDDTPKQKEREFITRHARPQPCAQACATTVDNSPLVCSAQKSRASESTALLRHIVAKLAEIEAQLKSPLAVRQLHLRYCCKCGERVTNANVGGYEGKSALTGLLFCDLCADELEQR
jgi:hypothetical protein